MLWQFLATNLLWSQGQTLLWFIIAAAILSYLISRPVYYLVILFFFFSLWFFRNPVRHCPEAGYDKTVIISPADGKVVDIQFGEFEHGFTQKVSICLSLFDVHVNWIPVDGTVSRLVYKEGAFTLAFLPKSSLLNERNDLYLRSSQGFPLMVRQIAGTIARRICRWVNEYQEVKAGQTYGMIRFGSRVELFLPQNASILVGFGQHVLGGQTVIARWTGYN